MGITVAAVAAKALDRAFAELLRLGQEKFSVGLAKWKNSKQIQELAKRALLVEKVKLLGSTDREVKLSSFYYPSKITFDTSTVKTIESLRDIPRTLNFVIQGTVGQGKSIFLRHLAVQELKESGSGRIPVFIELRRVEKTSSLKDYLYESLRSMGFVLTDDLFAFYASTGQFVFLLDAFDELAKDLISKTVEYLEVLAQSYEHLQIIITSRPDAEIQKSTLFRVAHLTPLARPDFEPLLQKIVKDKAQLAALLSAIDHSQTSISNLLTTPLLLTLLASVYKADQTIPDSVPQFYDRLFDVLLFRHDKSKLIYNRERHTTLSEREIRDIFEAFCFHSRTKELRVITSEQFNQLFLLALKATALNCNEDAFKAELIKIACLMQEEGFEYVFIHQSVQEYHAASYVKRRPEEFAQRFYEAMGSRWESWRQELVFLEQIDKYRFQKYFYLLQVKGMLSEVKLNDLSESSASTTALQLLMRDSKAVGFRQHADQGSAAKNPLSIDFAFGFHTRRSGLHAENMIVSNLWSSLIGGFYRYVIEDETRKKALERLFEKGKGAANRPEVAMSKVVSADAFKGFFLAELQKLLVDLAEEVLQAKNYVALEEANTQSMSFG